MWDGETLQVRHSLSSYPVTNVLGAFPSPDGRLFLMPTAEGGLWLTELALGAISPPVCLITNGPRLLMAPVFQKTCFSDQAKWLAVADGQTLRLWNLKDQPRRSAVTLATGDFRLLRFSWDERLLGAVTGGILTEQTVLVWDLASGKEIVHFQPHRNYVAGVDFSHDGMVLATASWDNTCKLLDLHNGQKIATLRGPTLMAISSVCFSPDGRRLAAGVGGGSLILWDLETQREVLLLKLPVNLMNLVTPVRFNSNGDSLLAVDQSGFHLWRAPSWDEIDAVEKVRARE